MFRCFVTLEDDYYTGKCSYFVEVATPQWLSTLMKRFENDFVPPGYPYIIVSKLTDDIIKSAIQAFIDTEDDAYWLKLYHIIPTFEKVEEINEILYRKKQEYIQLEAEADSGQ